MQLRPVVVALGRHKVATALIVLQVALTLAVASNALFIVATRIVHMSRATGTDEAHLFVIRNKWTIGQNTSRIDANIRTDLDALRHVEGVRDASSSNAAPLLYAYSVSPIPTRVKLVPDQTTRPQFAMLSFADAHTIDTLGVSLVAGRNFRPDEVAAIGPDDKQAAPVVIVTRSLADKLFPGSSALGKTIYLPDGPSTIIGILARLQGPLSWTRSSDGDNVLIPARHVDPQGVMYLVRTDSTAMKPVIAATLKALQERGSVRIIDPKDDVITLYQARERIYASDRSVTILMSIVCGLLLSATAGGIVGLSSFWVGQRRKQIGIRRSLGATRGDILCYFHAENLLIVGGGIALGIVLAILTNLGLMKAFYPMSRMPLYVPFLGALLLWLLGQLAVWGPARHAAKVPPVVAIRAE
ncbi:MAG TPA: FtsX-like permease family protein [Rhodanobacteraceae bacterium]|nr:FtsX-like permease family protein [Rhodanobacteraceae bacterium]